MKNDNVLVSIIVPVYKVPFNFLEKCINSLINQTYANIEIVLVDDGSPDECGKVCDDYAKKDPRIIVIHQNNKGLCGARNSGVKAAKGEWITFVDGDDWLELNAIDSIIHQIDETFDVVIFGTVKDYKNKTFKYNYGNMIQLNKVYIEKECSIFQEAVLDFESSIGDVTARLIKRKFLTENSIWHDEEIKQGVEAIDFNLKLFEFTKKIVIIPEYHYHYTFNDQSITNLFTKEKSYITLNGYKKIYSYLKINNKANLIDLLYIRIVHNIVSTAISGYFHPLYKVNYLNRKKQYKEYLADELIVETISNVDYNKINKKLRIILFLIKNKFYFLVLILAKIRYKQKNN